MNKSIIYARAFGIYYKLLEIVIRNDESIYIYFPKKKGYLIKSKQDVILKGKQAKTISFEKNIEQNIFNPYISYHPGKGVVHINAKTNKNIYIPFLKDRSSKTIEELLNSNECVPFTTIVFPHDILDFDYVNVPYKHNLILDVPIKTPLALSIDILIHKKGGYIDKEELPFGRIRNLSFMGRLNENLTNRLTYTLAINNMPSKDTKPIGNVFIFLWNKEIPFSFSLSPNK